MSTDSRFRLKIVHQLPLSNHKATYDIYFLIQRRFYFSSCLSFILFEVQEMWHRANIQTYVYSNLLHFNLFMMYIVLLDRVLFY